MEFNPNAPIHIQIENLIKAKIASGELEVGTKLPSMRDFAKEIKVNPNTVSRVYSDLENAGIVETKRGLGTFVVQNESFIHELKVQDTEMFISEFIKRMKARVMDLDEIIELLKKHWRGKDGDN